MRYVVDIDQTLLYSKFNEKTNEYEIIGTNDDLIVKTNELHRQGNEIIIWTGRHWNQLKLTKHQLEFFCIKYTTLMMGKPFADEYYIDDKAITPEDFLKLEEVEEKDTCDNKYQFGHIDTPEEKKYKCLLCGRDKFDRKQPHICKSGFRKRGLLWEEIT